MENVYGLNSNEIKILHYAICETVIPEDEDELQRITCAFA